MNFERGVHDPTIVAYQGNYYLFSTDTNQPSTSGVPFRVSDDLMHWQFSTTALNGVPKAANLWSKARGLWAPEIIRVHDKFRMYYSASTFGSTTSMIGLAEADFPEGPWNDLGEVIKTSSELCDHNAIDANVVEDKDGQQWLVYGSFFGGIYLAQIDMETGKLKNKDFGKLIAKRPKTVDGAIEGAFIIYRAETDYYYLFSSFDSLNDSYNVRVARSKQIDGDYLDMQGKIMTQEIAPKEVGVKLLGSYQFNNDMAIYAPGHNSILTMGVNQMMVHHARLKPFSDQFVLNIRHLFWLSNGWPVVDPYNFKTMQVKFCSTLDSLFGTWEIIYFNYSSELVHSVEINFTSNNIIQMNRDEFQYNNILFKAFFDINNVSALRMSGLTDQGLAVFGKKIILTNGGTHESYSEHF